MDSLPSDFESAPKKKITTKALALSAALFICVLLFIYYFMIGSFAKFPDGKIIYVKKGASLREVATEFKVGGIISSRNLLMMTIITLGGENKVVAGPYFFSGGEGVLPLALRLMSGNFEIKPLKITFPEGFTVKAIGDRLKERIPVFDESNFLALAKPKEGYLFPETYFFLPDVTATDTLEAFSNVFDQKISSLKNQILSSGHSLNEIITMASILEEEVRGSEDKKIVAGILWKRIKMRMPLQVDSTLAYEIGKTSGQLTLTDLQTDSPYNTYTRKGLPPTPISNPGLDSITAAVEPMTTPYLYFLTDSQGVVHYAKTFEEHKANKARYLR